MIRPSSCIVKGGIPSSRTYLPTYLPAWSPGVPAPPGPCYWLVTSETPIWLAQRLPSVGLVCGTVCHYCLGGCSALVVCARRSRQVVGGWHRCRFPRLFHAPLPCPALPAFCVAGRSIQVSLILARRYTVPCGLCVPRARSGCPSGLPRVPFACVCARASAASTPFPPSRAGVARTPRVVPVQGAGRAVPCSSRPSAFPAPVPCAV